MLSAVPRTFLFLLRLVPFVVFVTLYFLLFQFLPFPPGMRKLSLWTMMGIPGIWWVDLQIDGVKRGHLAQQPTERVPHPGSVIAASFTSPVDALYLAAIFDPVFTVSYPESRKMRRVSLLKTIIQALSPVQLTAPRTAWDQPLVDMKTLLATYPGRVIVVFPECSTTNGKGVLPLSPSLLTTPPTVKIFPVSLRYTPPDITTPVPGTWASFLWKLLSRPTHCIRVRIAESIMNTSTEKEGDSMRSALDDVTADVTELTSGERRVLDKVGEALARLGRNKRVGLTLKDKAAFVDAWKRPKTSR